MNAVAPVPDAAFRRASLRVALIAASAAPWLADFAITSSFPAMAEFSLPFSCGMYAAFVAISLLFVWRWVRKTRDVGLEDMPG